MKDLRILIVDDLMTVRTLISRILSNKMGVKNIFTAADGKEALQIIKENKVDLVISDWELPNMDGAELLREIRHDKKMSNMPFIMMSSNKEHENIVTALQLGATQYILKPFRPEELEEKLRMSWNHYTQRQANRYTSLPGHQAHVMFEDKKIPAQVIDISRSGALLSLQYKTKFGLFDSCEVSFEFLDQGDNTLRVNGVDDINGMIVRLETTNCFMPEAKECKMAIYFQPSQFNEDCGKRLEEILNWLKDRTPNVIDDFDN